MARFASAVLFCCFNKRGKPPMILVHALLYCSTCQRCHYTPDQLNHRRCFLPWSPAGFVLPEGWRDDPIGAPRAYCSDVCEQKWPLVEALTEKGHHCYRPHSSRTFVQTPTKVTCYQCLYCSAQIWLQTFQYVDEIQPPGWHLSPLDDAPLLVCAPCFKKEFPHKTG